MAVGTAMLVMAIASTAVSTYGAIKQGNAAKKAGEKQQEAAESMADLSDFNAAVADVQAQDALDRGAEDESRFRMQVRGAVGAQRAGFAAMNVDVGYGSALDVQQDAATLGELDALTIRSNAQREAWGYKVAAYDYRKRGEVQREEGVMLAESGRAGQTAARIGAVSNVIGVTGSLMQQRYGFGSSRTTNTPTTTGNP